MRTLEVIDSVRHGSIRALGPEMSGGTFARIILDEIPSASACCPLLLSRHSETNGFYIGALMGLAEGEILVDHPDGRPAFRPLEWDREGFFAVGAHMAIDPANDRFDGSRGESLFDRQGQASAPLKLAQRAIGRLIADAGATDAFIAAMEACRLIEPVDVSLSFDDGQRLRLEGLYTISLDAIRAMDDSPLLRLVRAGHLQAAYAIANSIHHIGLMARRRNAQLASL